MLKISHSINSRICLYWVMKCAWQVEQMQWVFHPFTGTAIRTYQCLCSRSWPKWAGHITSNVCTKAKLWIWCHSPYTTITSTLLIIFYDSASNWKHSPYCCKVSPGQSWCYMGLIMPMAGLPLNCWVPSNKGNNMGQFLCIGYVNCIHNDTPNEHSILSPCS